MITGRTPVLCCWLPIIASTNTWAADKRASPSTTWSVWINHFDNYIYFVHLTNHFKYGFFWMYLTYLYSMECSCGVIYFAYRLSSLIELMIFIEAQHGMMNSQDTGSRSIRCVCLCVYVEQLYPPLTRSCSYKYYIIRFSVVSCHYHCVFR